MSRRDRRPEDGPSGPQRGQGSSPGEGETESVNEVRLLGRVSGDPEERTLPSGDTVRSFRLVVGRRPGPGPSRQRVDTIDCAVWTGRVKRSSGGWHDGDVVCVEGALRRRFYRTPTGAASRWEVEVTGGRVVRRVSSA